MAKENKTNEKKQVELENNSTTENAAIENNTGAENISDTERHEPGEVLEVDETYFAELKEKDLAAEREE